MIHGSNICEISLVIGYKKHIAVGQIRQIFGSCNVQLVEAVKSSVGHESENENNKPFQNIDVSKRIGKNIFFCH